MYEMGNSLLKVLFHKDKHTFFVDGIEVLNIKQVYALTFLPQNKLINVMKPVVKIEREKKFFFQ